MSDILAEPKLNWSIIRKFVSLSVLYFKGDKKKQAWSLFIILIVFLCLVAGVNTFKTYISKWAINALESKNKNDFYQVIMLAIVFLGMSVPVTALRDYYKNKFALFWRKWFNLLVLQRWLQNKVYYNMTLYSKMDNVDQRIAQDLTNFTQETTRIFSIILTSIISIIAYIAVLYSISPWLVLTVFLYATFGTVLIVWLSRKLVQINFRNIRFQADYRYNLVHVRDNVECIALYQGETHEGSVLRNIFASLVNNYINLIVLQRNISFVSYAYNLFSALFPMIILAPSVLSGKMQVGTLMQGVVVFPILLTSLSVVITEFQSLSTLAAVVQRLDGFVEALGVTSPESTKITISTETDAFKFKNVTVVTPDLRKTLVVDLNLEVPLHKGLMIVGPSGCGKSSLLRAIAGLWDNGSGKVTRPSIEKMMFLPQKPYMLLGSLREQLIYPHLDSDISNEKLEVELQEVGLQDLIERVGGLDAVMKWSDLLSLGEQQRILFLRLFLTDPQFAVLDEASSALDEPNEALVYHRLQESGVTYISVGHRSSIIKFHQYILRLTLDHKWELYTQSAYQAYLADIATKDSH